MCPKKRKKIQLPNVPLSVYLFVSLPTHPKKKSLHVLNQYLCDKLSVFMRWESLEKQGCTESRFTVIRRTTKPQEDKDDFIITFDGGNIGSVQPKYNPPF